MSTCHLLFVQPLTKFGLEPCRCKCVSCLFSARKLFNSGQVVDRLSLRYWNSPSSDSPLTVDSQETRSDRCQHDRWTQVVAEVYNPRGERLKSGMQLSACFRFTCLYNFQLGKTVTAKCVNSKQLRKKSSTSAPWLPRDLSCCCLFPISTETSYYHVRVWIMAHM